MPQTAQPSHPNDPVAIVTGGSRGIGRAVVDALLRKDHTVWFCSRSQGSVDRALSDLEPIFPGRVFGRAVDVGDEESVRSFVAEVDETHGRIDVLVNNAGLGLFAPVDEISGDDWRRLIRANLDGPFYCTHAVAPVMKRRGDGFILNLASLAGRNAFAGGAAYNATKFGLVGFSEACMLDLRGDGIRVSCILPGSVDTEFFDAIGSPGATARDNMLRAEDVAQTVLDLLSYPARALPSRLEIRPSMRKPKD